MTNPPRIEDVPFNPLSAWVVNTAAVCPMMTESDEQSFGTGELLHDRWSLMMLRLIPLPVFAENGGGKGLAEVELPPLAITLDMAAILIAQIRTVAQRRGFDTQLTARVDQHFAAMRDTRTATFGPHRGVGDPSCAECECCSHHQCLTGECRGGSCPCTEGPGA